MPEGWRGGFAQPCATECFRGISVWKSLLRVRSNVRFVYAGTEELGSSVERYWVAAHIIRFKDLHCSVTAIAPATQPSCRVPWLHRKANMTRTLESMNTCSTVASEVRCHQDPHDHLVLRVTCSSVGIPSGSGNKRNFRDYVVNPDRAAYLRTHVGLPPTWFRQDLYAP